MGRGNDNANEKHARDPDKANLDSLCQEYSDENGVQTTEIAEAIKSGIEIITVCLHGLGRSVGFAAILRELGLPAAHMEGGFQQMYVDSQYPSKKQELLRSLPNVPYFIVLMADTELADPEAQLLKEIQEAFSLGQGKLLRLSSMEAVGFYKTHYSKNLKKTH